MSSSVWNTPSMVKAMGGKKKQNREKKRGFFLKKKKRDCVTSMKAVLRSLPERAVIFALIILIFKDSKTSQTFTIVSVLLLQVRLTTTVFSPIEDTLNCNWKIKKKNISNFFFFGISLK